MTETDAHRAVEAVWRIESSRVIAGIARMVHDVGLAEELAQDALVIALERWPEAGIPPNPGGWLMSTAKHRAVDLLRRRSVYERKLQEVGRDLEQSPEAEPDLDDHIGDDLLRLIFIACHPVLSTEARVALALRLLGGLTTEEIARAFLVPEATVAQRVVRAKRTLAAEDIPFELPEPAELPARLASVLEVLYLVFNEGYSATAGDDWARPDLCHEALRLGRVLAGLMPGEPEVHGLVALMELQASRLPARRSADGRPVLLDDQDRRRWDRLLIRRGLAALDRADETGGRFGPYALQATIAACHARAASPGDTDWARMAALYTVLGHVAPSPVVELNRAVAVGRAFGATEAGVPDRAELAVTGAHRATFGVGVRSGLRVRRVSGTPERTVRVPWGDSTVNGAPAVRVTVVSFGPMAMSKVRPCQCRSLSVTPPDSSGGSMGSRCTRSARQRKPVRPFVKTCA